jgi:lipoprotein-anchoring transpeptidase ErfK/SrfK
MRTPPYKVCAMHRVPRSVTGITTLLVVCAFACAQEKDADPAEAKPPVKTARDLIRKQEPLRVVPEVFAKATPENTRIVVNLAAQRAYLMVGPEACIDTPISSGKRTAPTPVGTFTVLEKIRNHQSATYGNFVDKRARVVRSGVSMKLDAAPAGTHFAGAPMPFFCRFTETGYGIHGGILPGYPASHGSIRVPDELVRFFYEKVRVGTPVEIRAE